MTYSTIASSSVVVNTKLYYEQARKNCMSNLKDVVDGTVVGSGTDYIVVQKGRKRILLHFPSFEMKELKNATTPYGSQID